MAVDIDPTSQIAADLSAELLTAAAGVGVGLAATQIGRTDAIFVCRLDGPAGRWITACNPALFVLPNPEGSSVQYSVEGCLSIPDTTSDRPLDSNQHKLYVVQRAARVSFSYFDLKGDLQREVLTGFNAVIVQHEVDHLHGVLICDHGKPVVPAVPAESTPEPSSEE
jgi:peptide deformylase